jgi:hypothetical protein
VFKSFLMPLTVCGAIWATIALPSVILELPQATHALDGLILSVERSVFAAFFAMTCICAAWIAYRRPCRAAVAVQTLLLYAAAAFLIVTLQMRAARTINLISPLGTTRDYVGPLYFPYVVVANMMIAGNAIRLARRASRVRGKALQLERALAGEQLRRLQSQLDPHDVFAAIERVRESAVIDPDAALREIATLGDRLRTRLEGNTAEI